jgi:hypothetical protein
MNKKNLYHYLKQLPVKLILPFVSFLISVYLFGFIVHEVLWEKEINVDNRILDFLSRYISSGLTRFMVVVSLLGAYYILILEYAGLIIWLLIKKKKSEALDTALVGITSGILFACVINQWYIILFTAKRRPGRISYDLF